MKNIKKTILIIGATLVGLLGFVSYASAVQVTVPSAPGLGYALVSTTTGNYQATTTDPFHVGSLYATSTTANSIVLGHVLIGTSTPPFALNNFSLGVYGTTSVNFTPSGSKYISLGLSSEGYPGSTIVNTNGFGVNVYDSNTYGGIYSPEQTIPTVRMKVQDIGGFTGNWCLESEIGGSPNTALVDHVCIGGSGLTLQSGNGLFVNDADSFQIIDSSGNLYYPSGAQPLTDVLNNIYVPMGLFDSIGSLGTSGKFLKSTGTGVLWDTVPSGSGTVNFGLSGQLAYYPSNGTTATGTSKGSFNVNSLLLGTGYGLSLTDSDTGRVIDNTGQFYYPNSGFQLTDTSNNLYLANRLFDSLGSAGTNGQFLRSTGSSATWSTLSQSKWATSTDPTAIYTASAGKVGIGNILPGATLDITGFSNLMALRVASSTGTSMFEIEKTGNVAIATSSAWALLSLARPVYDVNTPMFAIGSSTSQGTTTPFIVDGNMHTGVGTSSATLLNANILTIAQGSDTSKNLICAYRETAACVFQVTNGGSVTTPANSTILTGGISTQSASTITNSNNGSAIPLVISPRAATTVDVLRINAVSGANNGSTMVVTKEGNIGFGTTTPYGSFAIGTSTGSGGFKAPLFTIASSTGSAATTTLMQIDQNGHLVFNVGGTPTVSACGTTPTISGDDLHGTVTVGAGVVTACTITFYGAYSATPKWIGIETNSVLSSGVTAKSTTAFTVGFSATLGSGTFDYLVIQ